MTRVHQRAVSKLLQKTSSEKDTSMSITMLVIAPPFAVGTAALCLAERILQQLAGDPRPSKRACTSHGDTDGVS
jgi:hypothetical protein